LARHEGQSRPPTGTTKEKNVTRILSYLMTAILSVGVTLIGEGAVRAPKAAAGNAPQLTNAAFRDGRYMARLDIENGRGPYLSIGRWSTNADRASYVAGYQQAYPQVISAEGIRDQNRSLRFQLAENGNYRGSMGCPSGGNP
jgi:hypothetical protein